jgi:hypothetical protein
MSTTQPHPVELALVAAVAVALALRTLVVALIALGLLLAGWRPSRITRPAEHLSPVRVMTAQPKHTTPPALEGLTVAELRRRARAAGLPRALSHRGRKADLVAALS